MGFLDRLLSANQTPSGDPPELRRQIEKAVNGLSLATAAHDATWHLGEAAWDLDQDVGTIVFTTPQGIRAQAPVQIIGTFNTEDGTWLWGWDHPSVVPALAENAKKMLAYGQQHGFTRLTTRKLQCSEQECWELTALAYLQCGANGAYRGPAGTARVFMTFGEIQLSKSL
ncbi:MAG TPA: hypothetical protein VG269_17725 [Tepidisphaeraceae bacterium]|jgi:hypothetical protein|nr:hypothetical protein [Tepidisphaeraceae bacterium]